jgi:hypothetical protein
MDLNYTETIISQTNLAKPVVQEYTKQLRLRWVELLASKVNEPEEEGGIENGNASKDGQILRENKRILLKSRC